MWPLALHFMALSAVSPSFSPLPLRQYHLQLLIRHIIDLQWQYKPEECQKMLLDHSKGLYFTREVSPFT